MRKPYIDNLRNYTILLLFPVHTFMINPWFMPLLFVLAGISARYALETRTAQEFLRQRSQKLLLPFLSGLLLYVPFQSLYARKHFYNYNGTLGSHWKYFFTHVTDLSGYGRCFAVCPHTKQPPPPPKCRLLPFSVCLSPYGFSIIWEISVVSAWAKT